MAGHLKTVAKSAKQMASNTVMIDELRAEKRELAGRLKFVTFVILPIGIAFGAVVGAIGLFK